MNKKIYLQKIIDEFDDWYRNDIHSKNRDFYKDIITKQHLESLSDSKFVNFFYEFVSEGGKVQSGGDRTKNKFKETIERGLETFKSFVIEPFNREFDLNDWFKRVDTFPGFGVGIATIYLNRINYDSYPIMNNKTLKALNKLGYKLSSTKNLTNYMEVKKIQNQLIAEFPILENLYKADALNHFIVAIYKGQGLVADYLQIESFENGLEQNEIEYNAKVGDDGLNHDELYQRIKECERDTSEFITIKGKSYKRHNYLMVQVKRYRNYSCQFCDTTISKENGDYYIEACHIKAKTEGGKDSLKNILILCPNCHKLFDYGKRENEKHTDDNYSVILNGKKYKASLK